MAATLAELNVVDLFGLYSHKIAFKTDHHITAIIGPNGLGKTVCLKLIEALFSRDYAYFLQAKFTEARFTFTSGEIVSIRQIVEPRKRNEANHRYEQRSGDDPESNRIRAITVSYTSASGDTSSEWKPIDAELIARRMRHWQERFAPYLVQIGPNQFIDERTGQRISGYEVAQHFPKALPRDLVQTSEGKEPEGFVKLISETPCHLIETQRLLVLPTDESEERWSSGPHGRRIQSQLVVHKKAETLRGIIQTALSQYANLSQSRDRTFPHRVISGTKTHNLSEQQVRDRLQALDDRRQALMRAGILDTDIEPVAFEKSFIQGPLFPVLEIYIRDNEEKLTVFDSLLAKIDLFRATVNDRFLDKTIEIDRKRGFKITNRAGQEVPVDKLSSGEQHQLVIVFDLLFEVQEHSLILIDEPELSMHIVWQKSFIDGLTKMIALNPFDVVLATHSPVLIARHEEMVVELGDVGE
jgi:predicted ATP-binding protein involved in virulence